MPTAFLKHTEKLIISLIPEYPLWIFLFDDFKFTF